MPLRVVRIFGILWRLLLRVAREFLRQGRRGCAPLRVVRIFCIS